MQQAPWIPGGLLLRVTRCIWLLTQEDLYAMHVLVISLVVAVLAVARITLLLYDDQITSGYRRWVVNRWGEHSKMSYLVHCPWCTSMWVAMPIMPAAAIWPNVWVIAAFAIPAASLVSGLILDRKG